MKSRPKEEAIELLEDLWSQLGKKNTASRLGVAKSSFSPWRWKRQELVRGSLFQRIVNLHREVLPENYIEVDNDNYEQAMDAWYSMQDADDAMWREGFPLADRLD